MNMEEVMKHIQELASLTKDMSSGKVASMLGRLIVDEFSENASKAPPGPVILVTAAVFALVEGNKGRDVGDVFTQAITKSAEMLKAEEDRIKMMEDRVDDKSREVAGNILKRVFR